MLIGFVGDVHGHVLEALALILEWQRRAGRRLDLVIQLGDFVGATHAIPWRGADSADHSPLRPDELDELRRRDPGEFDLDRLLEASGQLALVLRRVRRDLVRPIWFIRGNHEDPAALRALAMRGDQSGPPSVIDAFGLFAYVPDGHVADVGGLRIAVLGGSSPEDAVHRGGIDRPAASSLGRLGRGAVDVLVTHDGLYGVSRGYYGQVQGSRTVSSLAGDLAPRWHVSGHLHHVIGPGRIGPTTYVGLAGLTSGRWDVRPGLMPGCLAVLDTVRDTIEVIDEPWLAGIGGYGAAFDAEQVLVRLADAPMMDG